MNKAAKKGFTMVELMAALSILALLTAMAAPGLGRYAALSRFRRNNEQARSFYLQAQARLSNLETGGKGEEFFYRLLLWGQSVDGECCAIVLQKDEEPDEAGELVLELLGREQVDASVCIEFDIANRRVCSVFYGTACGRLVYGPAEDGQTSMDRRDYDARKEGGLGYYSDLAGG